MYCYKCGSEMKFTSDETINQCTKCDFQSSLRAIVEEMGESSADLQKAVVDHIDKENKFLKDLLFSPQSTAKIQLACKDRLEELNVFKKTAQKLSSDQLQDLT
jgi:predicted RNA-binding protein with PIN domain